MTVDEVDPATLTGPDLDDWVAVHTAAVLADLPRDPEPTRGELVGMLRANRHRQRAWVARGADGRVVGTLKAVLDDTSSNTHCAEVELVVHPAARRRGTGRRLLDVLLAAAVEEGRRTVLGEALDGGPGDAFATAAGAQRALTDRRSVQRLDEVPGLEALCRDAVARAEARGYRLRSWTGAAPDELLEGFAAAQGAMRSAPVGDLDWDPETWTPAMVRAEEEALAGRGFDDHVTVALDAAGTVAGFTRTEVHRTQRRRAYQGDTGVLGAYRGHGLGLAVKAAQLLRLRAAVPELEAVETWNAQQNASMLRINELLGYRREDDWSEWQLRTGPGGPVSSPGGT